jgi:DNA-binding NarL/FixJ family response regulator
MGVPRLSGRETKVLRLIASGKSNQQIADALVLSLRTVERHITNLYAKIGAHGKADATAYALRHGMG